MYLILLRIDSISVFSLATNAIHKEFHCIGNFYKKINSFWKRLILLKSQVEPALLRCLRYSICCNIFLFLHQNFDCYILLRTTYSYLFLLRFWIMFTVVATPSLFFFTCLYCTCYCRKIEFLKSQADAQYTKKYVCE
jgi:hypothetical protein